VCKKNSHTKANLPSAERLPLKVHHKSNRFLSFLFLFMP
jgi:hypothetical protein